MQQQFRHITMRSNWSGDRAHVKTYGAGFWRRNTERLHVMRRMRQLALGLVVAVCWLSPAFAVEPDDLPWDEIDRILKESPPSGATSDDADPQNPAVATTPDTQTAPTAKAVPSAAEAPIAADQTPPPAARMEPTLAAPAVPSAATAPVVAAPAPGTTIPAQTVTTPVQNTATQTSPAQISPAQISPAQTTAAPAPPPAIAIAPTAEPQPPSAPAPAPVVVESAPAPSTVAPVPVATATPVGSAPLYLPVKAYFETKAVITLKEFEEADRTALQQYYDAHMGQALWVTRDGFNEAAQNLIAELTKADDWGLAHDDYKVPGLTKIGSNAFPDEDLVDTEVKLSLIAMQYGRHARGFRIYNPTEQLSSYIDRQPQLVEPAKLIDGLIAASDKGAYLRGLHPKHPQFELLRQKLLELRANANKEEFEKIPDGPKITPGKSHWQIALLRRRLKVPNPGLKPDGTSADENFYDAALARAVEQYKENNELEPVNTSITNDLRKSLNADGSISEEALLANMEQWRWMPADLGSTYIAVNIPEFMVRVVKDNAIIHAERIVSGKYETQTPIFSDSMRTVVFQPSWNVPESIKVNELLPKLRAGGNPIGGQGLAIKRNGRDIGVWDIDWETADIRQYHIYQPPGDANVLGIVKFLFPNKHSVYLHDTPSKSLFNQKVRTFSHGCMRVRNPVQLAEVIMAEDKGWDKRKINELITTGPEDNDVALDRPLPVHVTYFTAWVDDIGKLKTFPDVYGHQKRIILGLEGRWTEIVKNRDHLLPPDMDNVPVARNRDDWGDNEERPVRRSRQPRLTYREQAPPPAYKKPQKSVGDILQQVFGGF
jgi:L,D-transpeptidase YcbB